MPDAAHQLTEIGQRVLLTVRPLLALPDSRWSPDAYEDLLLDPVTAMAGICNELLDPPRTEPVAAERDVSPGEPGSPLAPDPNLPSPYPFSNTFAARPATRPARERYTSPPVPRSEGPATIWPGTPALDPTGPPSPELLRQVTEAPFVPLPDVPERGFGSPEVPAATQGLDRYNHYAGTRQRARHELAPRGVPHQPGWSAAGEHPSGQGRLDGEPSPEGHDETQHLVPEDQPGDGPPRRAGESDAPFPTSQGGARLASGTERLAAMLCTHVAATGTQPASVVERNGSEWATPDAEKSSPALTEGTRFTTNALQPATTPQARAAVADTEDPFGVAREGAALPVRPGDERDAVPVDASDRASPDSRASVEEIMERLADELETEFVRTYGSSGV